MNTVKIALSIILLVYLSGCVSPGVVQEPKQQREDTSRNQAFITGNQYARDGLLREAVDSYKKALIKDGESTAVHRNIGIVLVKAGDFASAITHLEKSMSTYADNFDANYYLAEAYRATDKYAEAIFRYKSALKIRDNDLRAQKSLAWSYYKIRFYAEALAISQKALTNNPSDDQIPIIVARVLLKLKRENESLAVIKKYSARAPISSTPYYQSVEAEVLYSKGQTDDAIATYKSALKSQPMLAGALLGIGKILLERGKTADAIDYLERAVRVKPKMYEAHYYLGRSLEKSNPQRAIRHLAHFRKNAIHDPEFIDQIQDAKQKITSISNLNSKSKIEELGD